MAIKVKSVFERRHYQAIADRIKLEKDFSQRQHLIQLFADMFAYDNEEFDLNKFTKACGN